MPLKSTKSTKKKVVNKVISENIRELYADNKKTGKEKGANWKPRPAKQIIAIAISKAKGKKK